MPLLEHRAFTTPSFAPRVITLSFEHDTEDVPLRTGLRLWSTSYALVDVLASSTRVRLANARVLELGSGVGACGLACATLGAKSVTITDRDSRALSLAHDNARKNGWFDDESAACDVRVVALDWNDPETYATVENGYDYVIAADMLYLPEHVDALATCIDAHLSKNGAFVAAFGVRNVSLAEAFERAMGDRAFDVRTEALTHVNEDMRNTAREYAHDEEIVAKGGYRLMECRRRRAAEASEDDALAEFAKDFIAGATLDRAPARARDGDVNVSDSDEDDDAAFDLECACAYAVNVEADEIKVGAPSDETVSRAAESLREHGFVVLQPTEAGSSAIVPRDVVHDVSFACEEYLNELLDGVSAKGVDPMRDIFRFSEICSRARDGLRYDFTHSESESVKARVTARGARAIEQWERVQASASPWVEPILARAYPNAAFSVKSIGCVTSEPSAPDQHFHSDGRVFGIVNVFVPLVATANGEDDAQGTAFIHGSHRWNHEAAYVTTKTKRQQDAAPRSMPELTLGSLLVYDYRVMHRGGANNSSKRRPLAYVMFGAENVRDRWNFPPDDSLWDVHSTGVR